MITYPNCKINLGLHVVRKRPDGYHDLETIFLPVETLHDELEITVSDALQGVTMRVEGAVLDCDAEENLCVKAYRLLAADFGERLGAVAIRLKKGIPFGAGLGGGSSDAAHTLMMLNQMFDLGLEREALCGYAAHLGADCPFFIENRPCYATGIGDQLTPIDLDLKAMGLRIEIAMPDDHVSTREAYAGVLPHPHTVDLREAVRLPVEQWTELIVNDFERSVFPNHPAIGELKAAFYARGARYAAMSGSGAAVFGIWLDEK